MHKTIFLFLAVMLTIACPGIRQLEFEYNDFIFGSYLRVVITAQDSLQAQQAISKVMQVLRGVDTVASSFKEQSEVSLLNKNGCALLSVDFKALITTSLAVSEQTNGAFDITVGSAMKSFYQGLEKSFDSLINYRQIQIRGDSIFLVPGMVIDLGGLAVGYALDKAADILKTAGIKQALIDAGGDIICFGDKAYSIGIKNPKAEGIIKSIYIKNQAISTSGNYEKFIEKDNQKYTHIINPKTGQPIAESRTGLTSVTIIADKCVDADAYATAVFVLGINDGQNLIRKLKLYGLLITNDGAIIEIK